MLSHWIVIGPAKLMQRDALTLMPSFSRGKFPMTGLGSCSLQWSNEKALVVWVILEILLPNYMKILASHSGSQKSTSQ